jgi:hypothetical protein
VVGVGVLVGTKVPVGVCVGVRVIVGVLVGTRVPVGVWVGVIVMVGVLVGTKVPVGVWVGVIVDFGIVGVEVGGFLVGVAVIRSTKTQPVLLLPHLYPSTQHVVPAPCLHQALF